MKEHASTNRAMMPRVFYHKSSRAATALQAEAGSFELVPISDLASFNPDPRGPALLLVDAGSKDLPRLARLATERDDLAVVALLGPGQTVPPLSDGIYAYLPDSAGGPILAKTFANAVELIELRQSQAVAAADLAALQTELQELNTIGAKLSAEHDTDALLELILRTSREITRSDAGSLYLMEGEEEGERRLRFKLAQNDSLQVPFKEFTLTVSRESVAGYVALTGETLNLPDVYRLPPDSPFQINRAFDQQVGYRTKSMLVVPMKNQKDEIIGVLQLINCKPDFSRRFTGPAEIEATAIPYSRRAQEFATSLASQAAVALENSRLYENIRILFEGFVKASVTAIESRDPTTSGHSFRVAELTVGLAEVVDRADAGPYASVRFSPDEMKEIRYASLLHDFGKVGVREEVWSRRRSSTPVTSTSSNSGLKSSRRGSSCGTASGRSTICSRKGASASSRSFSPPTPNWGLNSARSTTSSRPLSWLTSPP